MLDPGHEDVVNRVEDEFPLARTKYRKLFLQSDNKLSDKPQKNSANVSYDVSSENPRETFTLTFDKDTELTDYMSLHTYVEADGSDDMELHVTVEKLDAQGKQIPDKMTGQPIQAEGYLRVSQRALEKNLSTPFEPVLKHEREDLLKAGEIVPVDIAIWPMGMIYHEGEKLRLTIEAYRPPSIDSIPQFGSAKITIPNDGYAFQARQCFGDDYHYGRLAF